MSTDPTGGAAGQPPSEEELRAVYEEQLARVSSAEMALQAAASLLAVGGRRLGLVPGSEAQRDLEQVRDAIDGVSGLLPVLERRLPNELGPLREALSQLQLAYARETQAAAATAAAGSPSTETEPLRGSESGRESGSEGEGAGEGKDGAAPGEAAENGPEQGSEKGPEQGSEQGQPKQGPGPAEASGRLWVPGR